MAPKISSGLLGKRFMVHAIESGLKWGEEFPGLYQLYIQPRSEETSIFINGIQYNGNIAIYAVGNRINIVNDLDIESYVKSLLSVQLSTPMESEVMAAMAILAQNERLLCRFPPSRKLSGMSQLQMWDIKDPV